MGACEITSEVRKEVSIQSGHFKDRGGILKTNLPCDMYFPIFEMPPLYYLTDNTMKKILREIVSHSTTSSYRFFRVMPFYFTSGAFAGKQKHNKKSAPLYVKPSCEQMVPTNSIHMPHEKPCACLVLHLPERCFQHKCTHDPPSLFMRGLALA
mgnify:FL=1